MAGRLPGGRARMRRAAGSMSPSCSRTVITQDGIHFLCPRRFTLADDHFTAVLFQAGLE